MTNPIGPWGAVPQPPAPPEDIRTARQLWWGVVGFGIVQLVGSMLAAMQNRHEFAKQMFDQMQESDPKFTMATADLMVGAAARAPTTTGADVFDQAEAPLTLTAATR